MPSTKCGDPSFLSVIAWVVLSQRRWHIFMHILRLSSCWLDWDAIGTSVRSFRRASEGSRCSLWHCVSWYIWLRILEQGRSSTKNGAATPHNGSNIATCGKIIANIVTACSPLNPAKKMIGALQKDSKVLLEITEDFVPKTSNLQLVSFFEMEMTNLGFFKTMVCSASAFSNCRAESVC